MEKLCITLFELRARMIEECNDPHKFENDFDAFIYLQFGCHIADNIDSISKFLDFLLDENQELKDIQHMDSVELYQECEQYEFPTCLLPMYEQIGLWLGQKVGNYEFNFHIVESF